MKLASTVIIFVRSVDIFDRYPLGVRLLRPLYQKEKLVIQCHNGFLKHKYLSLSVLVILSLCKRVLGKNGGFACLKVCVEFGAVFFTVFVENCQARNNDLHTLRRS